MLNGLIVRSTGSWYEVLLESGEIMPCRMIGKFKLDGKKVTNPVAVGDKVSVVKEDNQDTGMIKEIQDRRNYVVRQSPRKKHFLHILAANIDQAILIVTIKKPMLKQGFIDRFLMMTEPYDIPVHILFNKSDLYNEDDVALYQELSDIYTTIGYETYMVSALEGDGIDKIKELIKDKTTLFSGQSGVGKSSLINSVLPNLELKTEVLSEYTGKGQHTTTFAEMFLIDDETKIIDSPGIKTLGFNHFEKQDVAHNFKEFFEASSGCKYDNCLHINEPNCAVKDKLETEEISIYRYQNYTQILEEIEDQNYWERNTG